MQSPNLILFTGSIVLNICLSSCTTGRVSISTSPKASDIYLTHQGKENYIGESPTELTLPQNSDDDYFEIRIIQKGYNDATILIPNTMSNFNHKINLSLEPNDKSNSNDFLFSQQQITRLLKTVEQVKKSLNNQEFEKAEIILNEIFPDFEKFAFIQRLSGEVATLRGKNQQAILFFKNAIKLDPEDTVSADHLSKLNNTETGKAE